MNAATRTLLRWLFAGAALSAVLLFVYRRTNQSHAATAQSAAAATAGSAERVVPVVVAVVEERDVPVWIEGLGTSAAYQQVTVRSLVDGRLDKVLFREGQQVKRGDHLAEVDPRPFQNQLHTAEGGLARDQAQLVDARLNFERYKKLREQQLIPQQQVDDQAALVGQLEGSVRLDQASIDSARLNLDYAVVKAPIDGVVGVRLVDAGNIVHAADSTGIVVLTQLDPAALFFTVPEDVLGDVQAAQRRGEVLVEAWSRDGKARLGVGKLLVIDNQINQATATLRLKAIVPNHDGLLWPNQFVKARMLSTTAKNAHVVPAASIQRGPQGTFVYVVQAGDTVVVRPVEVAQVSSDSALIAKGLEPGERVVVEGQQQLKPGAKVAPRTPSMASKSG